MTTVFLCFTHVTAQRTRFAISVWALIKAESARFASKQIVWCRKSIWRHLSNQSCDDAACVAQKSFLTRKRRRRCQIVCLHTFFRSVSYCNGKNAREKQASSAFVEVNHGLFSHSFNKQHYRIDICGRIDLSNFWTTFRTYCTSQHWAVWMAANFSCLWTNRRRCRWCVWRLALAYIANGAIARFKVSCALVLLRSSTETRVNSRHFASGSSTRDIRLVLMNALFVFGLSNS